MTRGGPGASRPEEHTVTEERAGTMIGSHSLKDRAVMKKSFVVIRLPAVGPPADGPFPEEELFANMVLFYKLTRAVP